MKATTTIDAQAAAQELAIRAHCRFLKLPTLATHFLALAEEAVREQKSHRAYLETLLSQEVEERQRRQQERRIQEARFPRLKRLEDFDFRAAKVPAATILELAQGGYIARAEPLIFIGDSGTGKTHLATGLALAACRQNRRVRFITAAALVNELIEAQKAQTLSRVLGRWFRYELLLIDEVGYVPLAETGAELLFQVLADRDERAAILLTTNLPFSEWTQVFTNARLCAAVVDRITNRAHIIETGSESYRFRRTLEQRSRKAKETN
jgi:DNA replication protein DnaC